MEAEKVAKAEVAVEVEEVHKEEEDDELNCSEKVQHELEREQGSEVDREADPRRDPSYTTTISDFDVEATTLLPGLR